MKVYVVMQYNWQDYEGGGGEVVSIHTDRAVAFAKVKKLLPANLRRRAKEADTEWYLPKVPAQEDWLAIEEYELE
jgi:hypothetical protein